MRAIRPRRVWRLPDVWSSSRIFRGPGGRGLRLGIPGYAKLSSTTGTLEYTFLRSHLLTRLEYRHDHSNAAFFGAGSNAVREQDTVTASAVYKF